MTEPLERDPVVLIHDVARLLRTRFDQRARASGMTRAQWHILARVDRQPGLSQRELAAICDVEPITVARLVDRLESRGLIERRPDPNDRRIWRLHMLPPAKPYLEEIGAYREALIRDIDVHIGSTARAAMVDTLLAVRARMTSVADADRRADAMSSPRTARSDPDVDSSPHAGTGPSTARTTSH